MYGGNSIAGSNPAFSALIKKKRLNKYLILLPLLLLSFLLSKEKAPAYIQDFTGDVFIQSSDQKKETTPAIVGRRVKTGDIIQVLENSTCDLQTEDKRTFIKIDANSEAKFIDRAGIREVYLKNGSLYIHNVNNNSRNKTYLFSNYSQIYLTNTKLWISINDSSIDKIYSFGDEIFISDKYKGQKLILDKSFFDSFPGINKENVSMIHATATEIYSIDPSNPEDNFLDELPEYISNIFIDERSSSQQVETFFFNVLTESDSLLFSRDEADLIPLYYSNTNVDIENNYGLNIYSGGSYLYNNYYNTIVFEPYLAWKNFEVIFRFDEYFRTNDTSLVINHWFQGGGNTLYLSPETLLSKISYMSLFNDKKTMYMNLGKLKNLSFGHGMLLHKYSNSYNYPIMQRTGLQIHLSPKNKYSYSFDIFVSDISETYNDGGLVGAHASLFLSKFFPLTVGFGYIYDFDQYSEVDIDLSGNSNIEARELDLNYSLINNNDYKVDIIYEWDGIFFSDPVRYLRNTETDQYKALITEGTQGHTIGGELGLDSGHKLMMAMHINQALYTPYYFSSTYDFEKVRTLKFDETNYVHNGNLEFLDNFCINGCNDGDIIYLSKELYPVMTSEDFVFPTLGTSVQYEYNYYNKRGISISGMYLFDNHPDSNNSYYLLDFEIFSKGGYLFDRLDSYKLYFHRNFTNTKSSGSNNENIMFGTILDISIIKSLKLYLDFQNVFYDIDEDTIVDHVKTINVQLKYEFK